MNNLGLSEAEAQSMLNYETMKMYNSILKRCFQDSVQNFSSKNLLPAETKSLENCIRKTAQFNERFIHAMNYFTMTKSKLS